jgi:hypothetical protein
MDDEGDLHLAVWQPPVVQHEGRCSTANRVPDRLLARLQWGRKSLNFMPAEQRVPPSLLLRRPAQPPDRRSVWAGSYATQAYCSSQFGGSSSQSIAFRIPPEK